MCFGTESKSFYIWKFKLNFSDPIDLKNHSELNTA